MTTSHYNLRYTHRRHYNSLITDAQKLLNIYDVTQYLDIYYCDRLIKGIRIAIKELYSSHDKTTFNSVKVLYKSLYNVLHQLLNINTSK